MTSNEIGVFVPPEACARLNTVVSGSGIPDIKARQERAIGMICSGEDLRRINTFAQTRPPGDLPIVFFRGQLLELMRWAVRCCPVRSPTTRT